MTCLYSTRTTLPESGPSPPTVRTSPRNQMLSRYTCTDMRPIAVVRACEAASTPRAAIRASVFG
eukprot:2489990-Rhodomonas_salina.1